jgi:hypothetical protein
MLIYRFRQPDLTDAFGRFLLPQAHLGPILTGVL